MLLALVMILGLTATAWATEGDETDKIVVIPGSDPVVGNNEVQEKYEIPFTKTVKLGGNTGPEQTNFTLKILVLETALKKNTRT